MKNAKLSKALRDQAEALAESVEQNAVDISAMGEVAELICVLARIVEGKTIDRSFGAPGDWGYGTPIGDGVFAMLREPEDSGALEWHYTEDELPDDEMRVLMALDSDHTEEPSFGYHAEDQWWLDELDQDGARMLCKLSVYAWAHTPAVPPKKQGGAS